MSATAIAAGAQAFVIGYDIGEPHRLLRVHRRMCRYATPLEYSVFLLVGCVAEKNRCLADVATLIRPLEDDVRCYTLPLRGFQCRLGRASLPTGIVWTGLPAAIG